MKRIILVKTCQKFRDRREACEETWAGAIRSATDARVVYVEGGYEREGWGETELSHDASGWRSYACDNVLHTASGDSYDDNSFKVRDAVRLLLGYPNWDRLFICDDNTFIHWRRWADHSPAEFEGLKTKEIPWVHGGGGWWMIRRLCQLYADGITRRCSWDDKLATEILEGKHHVPFTNRPDLYAQWDERVSADNRLITCHNVDPAEMRTLFATTRAL